MITFLVGENSFEIERELSKIASGFDGTAEKIDGTDLNLNQLPDLLMGVSLFATKRLVIIRNLSSNKLIWPILGDWLSKISDDIELVLIEPKPDKRTITYKALKATAKIVEFPNWTERDNFKAEKWAIDEAKKIGFDLDKKCAQVLVQRVGVDQWGLFHALQKLSFVDTITPEIIMYLIEASPFENVFNLFETAVHGDRAELQAMIDNLKLTEDAYMLSALLFNQAFQLAAVVSAGKDDNPAKDFGIHPFVVSKLSSLAKKLGKSGTKKIITICAAADNDLKSSGIDPWLIIENALLKIAALA